ncbi:peroxide stress protein YaaA [Catellatospora tritici]|uniref:peroxide stress protein YaaA n=1 Tax=Catellatospora tritici TaxID=2851566 RepID=UPI001C2D4D4D|nr:peroxide stress protein YaaA [Catellatospora tritici]MBV1850838.1 peroxide stress protein YaaA [Catellatospora tritici]MBV1851091.1 peroxide stress protein YaaA [Catellatospora tritici]
MLILLPPSEGKAASGKGKPVDPATLSLPALHPARAAALDALTTLCRGDLDTATQVLGLTPGLQPEIARNATLPTAAAMPAAALYTGVLYDALDLAGLPTTTRRRANRAILIFSGLWGAVRLDDRIPPYRCAMGVKLPGVGTLTTHWKTPMAQAMTETAATGLILDLRSSAYTPAWTPRGETADRTATVRVLHERPDGSRMVVSHFNKATKGRLVRDLLLDAATPRTPAQLADALRDLKYTVEQPPVAAGKPRQLDVIVNEL